MPNPYIPSMAEIAGTGPYQMPSPTGGWGYGYGVAPGQSNRGYYEQQTPVGSFAASEQQRAMQQAPVQAQYAGTSQATNPYIGQTTQGIQGAPSVSGVVQPYSNPYLGATSAQAQAQGANPYGMGNPYLQGQIDATKQGAQRSFMETIAPQLANAELASGSYGNTGVQGMRERAYSDIGRTLAETENTARFNDYTQQQGLAENALNRGQQLNMFNAGLGQADIARNLAGGFQQQGMNQADALRAAMFDAGNALGTQQFNAGLNQSDLARQTNAALGLGTFNAGQANQMGQFNASQGNQMGQFNANLGQALNMFNAGQGNAMNLANAGAANNMLSQVRNLNEQGRQFDENLDWNIDQGNWMRQRTGQQDQWNMLGNLFGWNQGGIVNANQLQNIPIEYLQQFGNIAAQMGGQGGVNSQNLQGNPYLGGLGGWLLASQLLGGQ